jgi:peptidoglycan/LPS O-acetylase OafA/YrhL
LAISQDFSRIELIPRAEARIEAVEGRRTAEYISHINAFRGLAIVLVVLTHIPSPTWSGYLVQNATVFFVFVSGALFSHLYDQNETTLSFWLKKSKRRIVPYVFLLFLEWCSCQYFILEE